MHDDEVAAEKMAKAIVADDIDALIVIIINIVMLGCLIGVLL